MCARPSDTAVAALQEIIALSMEDPHVRMILKDDKNTRDCLRKLKNTNEVVGGWSSEALHSIENNDVYDRWSDENTATVNSDVDVQQLLVGASRGTVDNGWQWLNKFVEFLW